MNRTVDSVREVLEKAIHRSDAIDGEIMKLQDEKFNLNESMIGCLVEERMFSFLTVNKARVRRYLRS